MSRVRLPRVAVAALTHVGALLADPTRSSLLIVLMDGRAHAGGELARLVGVAPSTASQHLSRLLDADYVAVEAQGRHRYFRLAGPHIAQQLESLGAVEVPATAHEPAKAPSELLHARSCYDHLALTPSGEVLLAHLGADVKTFRGSRRPVARPCLDWTERRHHLAGAAGAALFQALLDRGWIARGTRPRAIRVTGPGQPGLEQAFNL
jgi:DNA-binding transcriptional ArsR family regulator